MTHLIKRLCDVVGALIGLVLVGPLLVIVAALIRQKMGSPVFFRQKRPGYRGEPFTLLKFRTMRDTCDAQGNPLPNVDRVTPLGKFLRKNSLDELPTFWNVLKGEMSLVGPRPLEMRYLPHYNERQAHRHDVKPGVTGWTQCTFKGSDRTWEEKLEGDAWYVEHWSLWLDAKIMVATLAALVRRRKGTADGITTVKPFVEREAIAEPEQANGETDERDD